MDDRDDRHDDGRRDPDDLDERVAELEERVRELRAELGEPPRGPMGLPRPPTPREVLSFTGEYAIPTAIAVLEANLRALQALQQVIRVLDPERSVAGEERDRLERRAADASSRTLDRLEDALSDVETVVRESDLPREGEARDILEDARRINREIRDRVERSRRDADEARRRDRRDRDRDFEERSTTIELGDGDERDRDGANDEDGDAVEDDADDPVQVDVDAELESIKDEIQNREERADGAAESRDDAIEGEDGEDEGTARDGTDGDEVGDGDEAADESDDSDEP